MSLRTIVAFVLAVGFVAGCLSKASRADADILAKVGAVAAAKLRDALPSGSAVAGPLAPLRPARLLPVEERVRARFDTDAALAPLGLDVRPGGVAGQVLLRGVAANEEQRQRAESLAATTAGVVGVVNEIGVVE